MPIDWCVTLKKTYHFIRIKKIYSIENYVSLQAIVKKLNKKVMYLLTDNLIIKPLQKSDVHLFEQVYPDFYPVQYSKPLVSISNSLHINDKLNLCINELEEIGLGIGLVTDKAGNFIGLAGYSFIDEVNTYEINFEILSEHLRKGYETEICNALVDHAFNEVGLDKICAKTIIGNFNKDRCYTNAGFTFLGERAFETDGNIYLWNYFELYNDTSLEFHDEHINSVEEWSL